MYVLHKTLSLLKQAPKAWNSKIDSYFFSYFFHRIQNGRSVYVKKGENEDFLIVYLYILMSWSIQEQKKKWLKIFIKNMMEEFGKMNLVSMKFFWVSELGNQEEWFLFLKKNT